MNGPPSDAAHWLDRTHAGDCRQLLKRMHGDGVRVQMCVTSPPYFGLRSYLQDGHPDKYLEIGREVTASAYIRDLVEVFRAVREVLADDGTLWIVIGDTYAATRTWQAPSTRGGPKHAAAQQGAGGMRTGDGLKPKDMMGIPWALAFALRRDGWYLRQDIVWAKPNPMPESVSDRCTRSHEYLFLLAEASPLLLRSGRDPRTLSRFTRPRQHTPGQRTARRARFQQQRKPARQPSQDRRAQHPQQEGCLDHREQTIPRGAFRSVPRHACDALHSRRLPHRRHRTRSIHGQWHDRRGSATPATAFHRLRIEPVVHRPATPALMPIGSGISHQQGVSL